MNCVAILVNFFSSHLIVEAALSLANDCHCTWICVVDNSESATESAFLRERLPYRVQLIVSERNIGFGAACNLALHHHGDAQAILLLNPDARLLPGALARLLETMTASSDIGAVGPKVFWDEGMRFLMPPSTYPSNFQYGLDLVEPRCRLVARWSAWRFHKLSMVYWTALNPIDVPALSGGHVLLRRKAIDCVGGLFDAAFFMYWEDSDLMRRLNQHRWRLVMEPRAFAVHFYEHSNRKDVLMGKGWPAFERKHFGLWVWRWLQTAVKFLKCHRWRQVFDEVQLEPNCDLVMKVPLSLQVGWVLEFSPVSNFVPSIASFGTGELAVVPKELVQRFRLKACFVRLAAQSGESLARRIVRVALPDAS